MERRFSVGVPGGTLLVREEGSRAAFECELPDDGRGLYKAYLLGAGGRMLLGTLMPEGGRLRLRRTVTLDELTRRGFWPPTGGAAELAFPFGGGQKYGEGTPEGWQWERDPARLMGDRLLVQLVGTAGRTMMQRKADGFALAFPWDAATAFPMAALFCFAHPERLSAGWYVIYYFNRCGCPIFPHKGSETGQTEGAKLK